MISVVLTKYKRTHLFEHQLQSVINQSLPPTQILVVNNTVDNKGVWSRFEMAKKATNEFVCVIDDDTIPGKKWLENCYNSFQIKEGLYGTRGLRFKSSNFYKSNYEEIGWINPNDTIEQVDYVTHSWFFKKDWLEFYWRYQPEKKYFNCGEDMNFSFQLQKEGIKTFVPPHPMFKSEQWGSIEPSHGVDDNSLWESNENGFRKKLFDFFDYQISKGWKMMNQPTII